MIYSIEFWKFQKKRKINSDIIEGSDDVGVLFFTS